MNDVKVEIKGLDKLQMALSQLPDRVARKVLRRGVAAGGYVVRRAIKAAAPIRRTGGLMKISWSKKGSKGEAAGRRAPGFLKKKIGSRYRRQVSSKWEVHYGIGPVGPAYYGYIVATGHVLGKRKKYGRGVTVATGLKMVPAYNFITPAFESVVGPTGRAMKLKVQEGILKEAKTLGFNVWHGQMAHI